VNRAALPDLLGILHGLHGLIRRPSLIIFDGPSLASRATVCLSLSDYAVLTRLRQRSHPRMVI